MDKIAQLTNEDQNPFGNIIYAYTWDDAVEDGTFVEITGIAKEYGFSIPVAVTSNVFARILKHENGILSNNYAAEMLLNLHTAILESGAQTSFVSFNMTNHWNDVLTLWASVEARSPQNPEPVLTIMLPSER